MRIIRRRQKVRGTDNVAVGKGEQPRSYRRGHPVSLTPVERHRPNGGTGGGGWGGPSNVWGAGVAPAGLTGQADWRRRATSTKRRNWDRVRHMMMTMMSAWFFGPASFHQTKNPVDGSQCSWALWSAEILGGIAGLV